MKMADSPAHVTALDISDFARACSIGEFIPEATEIIIGPTAVLPGAAGCIGFWSAKVGSCTGPLATIPTACSLVVLGPGWESALPSGTAYILSENPRRLFIEILTKFFTPPTPEGSISDSAVLDPLARVSSSAYIAPGVVIGRATVGEGTMVGANTVIADGVVIGNHCHIGPNCSIGQDGYGYERTEDGRVIRFPHYGGVRIGDRVHIGAGTCIDRGTLGDTRIDDDAKIDNLVHIAHNVVIGAATMVVANCMVAGGCVIGPGAYLAPSSSIRDGLTLGSRVFVGMAANVIRDVTDDDIVMGNPARSRRT